MSTVLLEKKDRIATVTINRPEALNALNAEVMGALEEAFKALDKDSQVDVVILTGTGRSFVAGADITAMLPMTAVEGKAWGVWANEVFLNIENLSKPVIAAVNGFALGGGCELAMACDVRIASEKAKFAQPEVGLGITPGFGGTQRLPRIVGTGRAMELILSGRQIDAVEAERIGLVNRVLPHDQLMAAAEELARSFLANAQIAVRQAKRCIRKGTQTDIDTGVAYEAEAFGLCFSTEDQTEGMSAFVEKRKEKHFQGR
ncbi:enoyl-CoA hydratase-related protein [Lawsonibacter celer]|uniref:enoyl-CoA hydratase-related protein n=1 Tax=Lawsonibacter celer TaxID=2986526 RepID=UPI001644C01E|nr:enoyl-CoA hydratase-related protein [Lawsonibacter celer]